MNFIDIVELRLQKVRQIGVPFDFCYGVEQAGPLLLREIGSKNVETFVVLCLSESYRLLCYSEVSVGGTYSTVADLAQLMRVVLLSNATKIIVAHNHPDGSSVPSESDISSTKKIARACQLMGIQLVDSIIVTMKKFTSIRTEIVRHE